MAITLGSNISSLRAQRTLNKTTQSVNNVYTRLSSGFRINRASDDAAGLAIADSLRADQRVANVAIRNANDGISTIAIADGALSEIGNVLQRLAELSEQSANGVYNNQQRSAIAQEFEALGSEIERIALTTQFNGVNLLSGTSGITFQVGFDSQSTSQIGYTGVQGTLASLGLAAAGNSSLQFSIIAGTTDASQSAARQALDAVNAAIGSVAQNRGVLGATESRLNVTISNLAVARENFGAAESQIRDTDIAADSAELTRLGILQQAGVSVLAQANQQPALAVSLLN